MGTVHAKEAEAASSGPVSLQSVNAQVTKVHCQNGQKSDVSVYCSLTPLQGPSCINIEILSSSRNLL